MPVDRLKSLFAKTLQDSKQHDTVGHSAFTEQSPPSTPPTTVGAGEGNAAPAAADAQGANRPILAAALVAGLVLAAGAALYVLTLQDPNAAGVGLAVLAGLVVAAGSGFALSKLQRLHGLTQQSLAEAQMQEAAQLQQDAKRINDANQAAILRLMNELQTVAEGDLTQQATVTEDITGAIADSVNYTVEELRSLVSSVQTTASKVAQTTSEVDATSTELLKEACTRIQRACAALA